MRSLRSSGVRLALAGALLLTLSLPAQASAPAADLATYADQVLSAA